MTDKIKLSEGPTGPKSFNNINSKIKDKMETNNIRASYNPDNGLSELIINGQVYTSAEKDTFHVPISVIKDINLNKFPVGITILPDTDKADFEISPEFSMRIKILDGKKVSVELSHCTKPEKHVYYYIAYSLVQELVLEHLLLNKQFKPKILVNEFDGKYFRFRFSIELPAKSMYAMYLRILGDYFNPWERILKASSAIPELLRKNLNLPAKPNEKTKVKDIQKCD
jgi:hypothetical protein